MKQIQQTTLANNRYGQGTRKLVRGLTAAVLSATLLLAGCQGSGSAASAAEGTTEVTLWHALKGANGEALNQMIERFNQTKGQEKKIHVSGVFQGTEITSKLKIAAKESDRKNMPDITQTVGLDIPTVLRIPGLVPAETLLKESGVKKDDYYEPLLRAFTYQDQLIGLPISTSTILLYYNKALLQKAGYSQPPKTLAELAEMLPKLTVKEGQSIKQDGLNVKVGRHALVNFLASQKPEAFIGNEEGGRTGRMTQVIFDQDGTLEAFLKAWEPIVKSGGYKATEDNINEEFATGVHAMAIMSSARIGTIEKLMGGTDAFGVAFLPKVSASDTSGAAVGGSALCLYDNGNDQKKAAAWEFIQFATSAEEQAAWSKATGYLPAHKDAEKHLTDFYQAHPQYKVPLEQMKASNPLSQEPFDHVGWKVDGKIADIMVQFANGALSREQTAKAIVEAYNGALAEFNRSNPQ